MEVFNYYLKAFPHEILPVDAVWSWWSCIYQEIFKDIFEENKQGFDGKSWTLTHFIAFEEHKSLLSLLRRALYSLQFLALAWWELVAIHQVSKLIFLQRMNKHVCLPWIKYDSAPSGGVALNHNATGCHVLMTSLAAITNQKSRYINNYTVYKACSCFWSMHIPCVMQILTKLLTS